MEEELVAKDTHPDIVTIIHRNVQGNILLVMDALGHPEGTAFQTLLEEQHQIGWKCFFLRFWSKVWREIQSYYLTASASRSRVGSWILMLQILVWYYTRGKCDAQN